MPKLVNASTISDAIATLILATYDSITVIYEQDQEVPETVPGWALIMNEANWDEDNENNTVNTFEVTHTIGILLAFPRPETNAVPTSWTKYKEDLANPLIEELEGNILFADIASGPTVLGVNLRPIDPSTNVTFLLINFKCYTVEEWGV
jgi:hypothetical protein